MKVGILSMQRVRNWGSFLQAFALKKKVEDLGHDCSFLDVKSGVGLTNEELFELNKSKGSAFKRKLSLLWLAFLYTIKGQFFARLKSVAFQKDFAHKYDNDFLPILGIDPSKYEYEKEFDVVIIGSDEVFNCTQANSLNRTMQLFGEGINAKKVISYAASFGYTTVSDLEKLGLKERIQEALSNISEISVRDENSSESIKQLTGNKSELCVDPVIIYNFDAYLPDDVPEKDYLIVYTYQGRITDSATINAIKKYAKSKNKQIISLYSYYVWSDKCITPIDPFELLAYFAYADYIVTDTFHGSIFSMKYNRNFCTIIRDSNANKLGSLLKQFELTDRIVKHPNEIEHILEQKIDYSSTNAIIESETLKAEAYLKSALTIDESIDS
ncbi:MAG: polysaccharide pyruvyl transferase family protein [Phycisphaerae bacterium]|nr:polysaccharide pyruvyl transferase family protein [Phycisphaerae bacterium]